MRSWKPCKCRTSGRFSSDAGNKGSIRVTSIMSMWTPRDAFDTPWHLYKFKIGYCIFMYIPFGWCKGDTLEFSLNLHFFVLVCHCPKKRQWYTKMNSPGAEGWGSSLALLLAFLRVPNQQDQSSHSVCRQGNRPKTKVSKIPKDALLLQKLSCLVDIQHHHLQCHHALLVTVTQCNHNVIT